MKFFSRNIKALARRNRWLAGGLATGALIGLIGLSLLLFSPQENAPATVTVVSEEELPYQDLPEIAATGRLPSLQQAMQENDELRRRVAAIASRDESYFFFNIKESNREVADIIFLWSGQDISRGQRSVNKVLREVYNLGGDITIGHPLVGDNPWPLFFNRVKARLLTQSPAIKALYTGPVTYDVYRDRIFINGELSMPFINAFSRVMKEQPDPRIFIGNLLIMIDETKGIQILSEREKQALRTVQAIKGQPSGG